MPRTPRIGMSLKATLPVMGGLKDFAVKKKIFDA